MASICVVKFDGSNVNEISLVPETYLQSSKNVKVKINGGYLFVDKHDRQRRVRGKLLFKGTFEECEEYCLADTSLTIDSSTWFSNIASESNTNNKVLKHTTFKPTKRKNDSEKVDVSEKQLKTNSLIIISKTKPIQQNKMPEQNKQSAFERKKQQSNEQNVNDDTDASISNTESSILVDPSNNDSFDNNVLFKGKTYSDQSKHQTKLPEAGPEENGEISNDNMKSDDEIILPRHVKLELKSNRKKIVELENQLKELKHTSIPFPTSEESNYLCRLLAVVDMRNELANTRAISCGNKLGLTDVELLRARGNGKLPWKKVVVNLITACFKDKDLQFENYTTLRNSNEELIDNISDKVLP